MLHETWNITQLPGRSLYIPFYLLNAPITMLVPEVPVFLQDHRFLLSCLSVYLQFQNTSKYSTFLNWPEWVLQRSILVCRLSMPVFYRKLFVFLLSSIRNFQSAIHRPNTSSNTYRCGYLQIGRWQDHVLKLIGWTPLKERCNMALCHTHQDWSIPSFNCPECWQLSTFLIEELCLAKPRPFAGVGWGGGGRGEHPGIMTACYSRIFNRNNKGVCCHHTAAQILSLPNPIVLSSSQVLVLKAPLMVSAQESLYQNLLWGPPGGQHSLTFISSVPISGLTHKTSISARAQTPCRVEVSLIKFTG